eukprot:873765_1
MEHHGGFDHDTDSVTHPITSRIELVVNDYINGIHQSLSGAVIVPKDIFQLILLYLTHTIDCKWIKLKEADYCAPPILINKRNEEDYILISPKHKAFALSKYYEETDVTTGHERRDSERCGLELSDHTISTNADQSLLYIAGGYKSQFAIYSLVHNDWLRMDTDDALIPFAFGCSWYSPSLCINNDFHWTCSGDETHYIWNHQQQKWYRAFGFDRSKIRSYAMIFIKKLNKMMMLTAIPKDAMESNSKGSIWFSSTVDESKMTYTWTKELELPFDRALFGWIQCTEYDMMIVFGGVDRQTGERHDDIWCLHMNGTEIKEWKWKQLSFKCPSKCWYHAVCTEQNLHLFDSYGGRDHWVTNLDTIVTHAIFS